MYDRRIAIVGVGMTPTLVFADEGYYRGEWITELNLEEQEKQARYKSHKQQNRIGKRGYHGRNL